MTTLGRKACRSSGQRCDPQTIGECLYCLVHHSAIGAKQIADAIGVRPGYLSDAANPDRDDVQFQARLIVPVTLVTKNFVVLDYLESAVGRVAFALPGGGGASDRDVVRRTCRTVAEFGEYLQHLEQVLVDERVTDEEARRLTRQSDEAVAAIAALTFLIRSRVEAAR